jgi:hypothetical protein
MQLSRGTRRGKESAALRALKASALALSGVARVAAADAPIDEVYTSYSFSNYDEDELEASKGLPNADRKRYEVSTQQAMLAAPLTDHIDFSLEVTHETMSGASPWYTVPDAAGAPIQIMSGPTIEDKRDDFLVKTNYYLDNARLGLASGYSSENDYSAINLGFDGETHFNEKNTTLSGGIGMSYDEIDPTDADLYPTRPAHETKQTYSLNVGLAQILNRRSVVQSSLSYAFGNGYLSDPYKQVFAVGGVFFADARPDARHAFSWLTRYNRHIEEFEATMHLSYQYYWDTWGVSSHTLEVAWYQSYGDNLQITPTVRYYTQNEADIYVNYLPIASTGGGEHSSDYRLSSYGALGLGLKAEYLFRTPWLTDIEWKAKLSYERYLSSADLAFNGPSVEAPGLVSFGVFSIGISAAF